MAAWSGRRFLFCAALTLSAWSHAQLYRDDANLSLKDLQLRSEALNLLAAWEIADNADPRARAVIQGRYRLTTSMNPREQKMAAYLEKVIAEVNRSQSSTRPLFVDDYLSSNARVLAIREDQKTKAEELAADTTLARDPATRLQFEFLGPQVNRTIRDFTQRAHELRNTEARRLLDLDQKPTKKIPETRTVDRRRYLTRIDDFPVVNKVPFLSNVVPFPGLAPAPLPPDTELSGASAEYAIGVEREMHEEVIANLRKLRQDPKLSQASVAKVDREIQTAQDELKAFDAKVETMRKEQRPYREYLDDPASLPEFKYYPYPQSAAPAQSETSRVAGQTRAKVLHNIDFLPTNELPPRGQVDRSALFKPEEGLTGHSAEYAIRVEREAREEHLADLTAFARDPRLDLKTAAQAEAAVHQAQYELDKFNTEIEEFRRLKANPASPLAGALGELGEAPPRVLPDFKYYPYAQSQTQRSVAAIESDRLRAKTERQAAVAKLAESADEIERERAAYIDNLLPGYSTAEREHLELNRDIALLGRQISVREKFNTASIPAKVDDTARIYPMINHEFMLWQELKYLDQFIATQTLTPEESKYVKGLGIIKNDYSTEEMDKWKARRTEVAGKLVSEIERNMSKLVHEKSMLVEKQIGLEDRLTRQRLGLDPNGTKNRIAELEGQRRAVHEEAQRARRAKLNQFYAIDEFAEPAKVTRLIHEIGEIDARAEVNVKHIDKQLRLLYDTRNNLEARREIAREHYAKNPFINRHIAPRPAPSKILTFVNATAQRCNKLLERAAVFFSL